MRTLLAASLSAIHSSLYIINLYSLECIAEGNAKTPALAALRRAHSFISK